MSYKAKNILVTGGSGFIGCNYINNKLLQDKDCYIVNLDLLTYAGSSRNVINFEKNQRYKFIQGDINDRQLVVNLLLQYQIDTIVHFAAESHVDRSILNPSEFIKTNLVGTFNLLEAAKSSWLEEKKLNTNQCRYHHISTDEIYGSLTIAEPAFSEVTAYKPNSPYSASKAGSNHLVSAYFHTFGLPVTITNCSNNYGPYQHTEKLIPTIINACRYQQSIPIYGDGSNIRDWLYVIDHCIAIDMVIAEGQVGESYNVGGSNEISNIELAKHICHIFDELFPMHAPHAKLIRFVEDRKGHDWRYAIDVKKITTQLDWQPEYDFENGLRKTLNFYLDT